MALDSGDNGLAVDVDGELELDFSRLDLELLEFLRAERRRGGEGDDEPASWAAELKVAFSVDKVAEEAESC